MQNNKFFDIITSGTLKRGRGKVFMAEKNIKAQKIWQITGFIFCILAFLCLLYFIFLKSIQVNGFDKFWIIAAFILAGLGLVFIFAKGGLSRLPKWLLFLVEGIVAVGCIIFIVLEAVIISFSSQPKQEADSMIILGAKVNGTRPSLSLKARLDVAAEYLNENKNCYVVVSGGKGADEGISEAQCMYEYLLTKGISPERITLEDKSTSTKENLVYSARKLDVKNTKIIIVTNDFHVFRSVQLAKRQGYNEVYGLPAKSPWYLIPTNYTREFMAICKDYLYGNLR